MKYEYKDCKPFGLLLLGVIADQVPSSVILKIRSLGISPDKLTELYNNFKEDVGALSLFINTSDDETLAGVINSEDSEKMVEEVIKKEKEAKDIVIEVYENKQCSVHLPNKDKILLDLKNAYDTIYAALHLWSHKTVDMEGQKMMFFPKNISVENIQDVFKKIIDREVDIISG